MEGADALTDYAAVGAGAKWRVFSSALGLLLVLVSTGGCNALRPSGTLEKLVARAIKPEQHMALADAYRRRAADARAQMNHHFALAAQYRGAEWEGEQNSGTAAEMAEHCANLARDYEKIADEYETLANNHESLAVGEHGSVPPYERRGDRGR